MSKITITTCGIVGYGKLGSILAEAVSKKNRLLWIIDNNKKQRELIYKKFYKRISIYYKISNTISIPDIIIISANDSHIEYVAKNLSIVFENKLKDVWVVHCSGVLPVSVLSSCEKLGAKTACIHPFQTFYYPEISVLKNIGWSIETNHNPQLLQSFITQLGGKPVLLPYGNKQIKVLHHLSAVFASNFLSTVLAGAGSLEEMSGMNRKDFLPQIIDTTIRNNFKSLSKSEKIPLTGPIARADVITIKTHLKSLSNHRTLRNTYIYLSLATLETAKHYRIINKQKFAEIKEILLSSLKD
ncbi:MAG: DUF2520 domain-containing protein [Bacteroidetes bacterium]|nr:DUF2520 domain-containing protein [Bacteroidota bacterium]